MTISNFDIMEMCKSAKLPIVGVYSKDELPNIMKPGSYYVNLQDSDEGDGSHWVMFYIDSKLKNAVYFDSFGFPPPLEVKNFLSKFKNVPYSNRQIQDIKSTNCGLFCIGLDIYLKYYSDKKLDLEDNYFKFINLFSHHTETNDEVLKNIFIKFIN